MKVVGLNSCREIGCFDAVGHLLFIVVPAGLKSILGAWVSFVEHKDVIDIIVSRQFCHQSSCFIRYEILKKII
jgi:hypothetical protein